MMRKYKLERLQKHLLLGFSGVTLASTMFFGSAQITNDKQSSADTYIIEAKNNFNSEEVKILNKAKKDSLKFYSANLNNLNKNFD